MMMPLLVVTFVLVVWMVDSTPLDQKTVARNRRPPRQPTNIGDLVPQPTAFVLNLGTSNTAKEYVTKVFHDSLSAIGLKTMGLPTVTSESNRGTGPYIIVMCATGSKGHLDVDGLEMLGREQRRKLRHRRRHQPYYQQRIIGQSMVRRERPRATAESLIRAINERADGEFIVTSLFGTDSSICGDVNSPTPNPIDLNGPTVSPITRAPSGNMPVNDPDAIPSSAPSRNFSTAPVGESLAPTPTISNTEIPSSLIPSPFPTNESDNSPTRRGPTTRMPTHEPDGAPSISPSIGATDDIPTELPSVSPLQNFFSQSPSLAPISSTEIPSSILTSLIPSGSASPSTGFPTVSLQPTTSLMPSLPPPDWEQFGNTIRGRNIGKVILSDDGTLATSIFLNCDSLGTACGRVFRNTNLGPWLDLEQDIYPPGGPTENMIDVSMSGDGSRVVFLSIRNSSNIEIGDFQQRQAQVFSLPDLQAVGSVVLNQIPYQNSTSTSYVCVHQNNLVIGMGNGNGTSIIQAYEWSGRTWAEFGEPLGTEYGSASMEFSGDCRTVILLDPATKSYVWKLDNAGAWKPLQNGMPSTKFAGLALDGGGVTLATRSFETEGSINIYRLESNGWQSTSSIVPGQVYESNYGFKLDLSAGGTTIAVATFRYTDTTSIACTQAFQFNTSSWVPMGRPPCFAFDSGHAGFGSFISVSGEGTTMSIGDIGSFADENDRGHIHFYEFIDPTLQ